MTARTRHDQAALSRRQTSASDHAAEVLAEPGAAKLPGARVLSAGAKGAERVARAAGVDQFVNEAVEEAVLGALRSPAIIRAIERAIESHALTAELNSDEVRQIVKRVLESDVGGAVWAEFLESDQVQLLVERIARAPEVRAAIAAQGAGLITDVGVRLTIVSERLDDAMERVVRPGDADSEVDEAGLATRAMAAALDLGLLFIGYSLLSGVLASLVSDLFGKPLSQISVIVLSALGVLAGGAFFASFWALAGQTPGMRFLAIRLTHHGSRDITLGLATRRVFAVILSLLPLALGYLVILRDPQRRAWADRVTGTKVIYDSAARSAARGRANPNAAVAVRPPTSGG